MQQFTGNGDLQVGLVIVGNRHHALALWMLQTGLLQVQGFPRIAMQGGYVIPQALQFDDLAALFIDFNDYHMIADIGQTLDQCRAGFSVATDQIKRQMHLADQARQSILGNRLLEGLVLGQREDGTDRIQPGDDAGIDRYRHP